MIRRLLSITAVIVLALASLCLLAVSAFATLHRGKILRGPHANLLNERMDAVFRKVLNQPPAKVSVQSPGKYTLPLDAKTYVAGRSFPRPDDTRDRVLRKNTFAKCREGRGVLVGGLDTRPEPVLLGEPKYVCGVQHLGNRRPCVVYSFGSSNEIMFEIGIKALAPQCDVHTFDHITLPEAASVRQFNFSVHRWALGTGRSTDPAPARTLDAIMRAFNHSHVDILKIDIENAEVAFLDWLFRRPSLMKKIDQIAIEFHSVRWMRDYIGGLVQRGFRPTHARVNDAHDCCAEVAFQSSTVTIE